jgi:hypothetical protein
VRLSGCGAALAFGLVLGGCGGATKTVTVSPLILNTERVELSIQQSILAKRHVRAEVSCPSGVHQHRGLTFYCQATFPSGAVTRFRVKQVNNAGGVSYVGL